MFYTEKIQRLRPGLNPRTREPEASMRATRPPKPSIWGGTTDVMLQHEAYHENLSLASTQIDTSGVLLLNRICSDKTVAEFVIH
jgi:hypothetical protein